MANKKSNWIPLNESTEVEDAIAPLMDLYKQYYAGEIKYTEYNKQRDEVVKEIGEDLLKHNSMDSLRKEWFKDYGTMNGWGAKTSALYSIACYLHGIDVKKNPELHEKIPQRHGWRGWHEDNCSCGLCSSSDSSD